MNIEGVLSGGRRTKALTKLFRFYAYGEKPPFWSAGKFPKVFNWYVENSSWERFCSNTNNACNLEVEFWSTPKLANQNQPCFLGKLQRSVKEVFHGLWVKRSFIIISVECFYGLKRKWKNFKESAFEQNANLSVRMKNVLERIECGFRRNKSFLYYWYIALCQIKLLYAEKNCVYAKWNGLLIFRSWDNILPFRYEVPII